MIAEAEIMRFVPYTLSTAAYDIVVKQYDPVICISKTFFVPKCVNCLFILTFVFVAMWSW